MCWESLLSQYCGVFLEDIIAFFELLNKTIVPAKSRYTLIKPHLISHVPNSNMIEVILFPIDGGQYHIPAAVEDKTIIDIVKEIDKKYQRCLIVGRS